MGEWPFQDCKVFKTQMGTTLSDCSHFVAGKLLCRWRQATVIMVGCFLISSCLRIQLLPCNPSPLDSAFYNFILLLSLRSSFRLAFPDGVSLRLQLGSSLTICSFAAWNISNFSAFLSPGISCETFVSVFPGPELNLPMNDWRFFLVVWTIRLLFSFNLWLFHCANPKVWMIRFFTQLRVFPRLHNFRVTFYRLPDISKIQHKWPGMQLFWDFCINFVSTYIINNCL